MTTPDPFIIAQAQQVSVVGMSTKVPSPNIYRVLPINKKDRYKQFQSKKDERIKQMGGVLQFPEIDSHLKQQNEQAISRFLRDDRKSRREETKR